MSKICCLIYRKYTNQGEDMFPDKEESQNVIFFTCSIAEGISRLGKAGKF